MDVRYHTTIRQISVCLSVRLKFDFRENRSHGQCVARNPTMCLLHLSLYGCGQLIELSDFVVWCSAVRYRLTYRRSGVRPADQLKKILPFFLHFYFTGKIL